MKVASVLLLTAHTQAWMWDPKKGSKEQASASSITEARDRAPDNWFSSRPSRPLSDTFETFDINSRLPNIYAVAIKELEELQSEPLCHRIAAKLLVNDCQMLDGKDEATVLTDSGRQVRDFVDFYAASLAICDLERGGFLIPTGCAKFREEALSAVPAPQKPGLHVSSKEIDLCLNGLAKSDSAWNTWISYRHKALRFCEAARADNEKAQNIYLYQRITKVLEKLTNEVDAEMDKRIRSFDAKISETGKNIESLTSVVGNLRNGLGYLKETLFEELERSVEDSTQSMRDNLKEATNLKQILAVLLSSVLQTNAEVSAAHETAIDNIAHRTNEKTEVLLDAITAAVSSMAVLGSHMEQFQMRAEELQTRQDVIEEGLSALWHLTQAISAQYHTHNAQLSMAGERVEKLVDELDNAITMTTRIQNSVAGSGSMLGWWPYLVCPVLSLMMGSYGLPPSGYRNIMLILAGEGFGFLISKGSRLMPRDIPSSDRPPLEDGNSPPNITADLVLRLSEELEL